MTIQEQNNKKNKNKKNTDKYQIQPTLQELQLYHQYTPNTLKNIQNTLQHYCTYQQNTLPELLQEAINDENTTLKVNRRQLKQRLQNFTLHLQQQGKQPQTIKIYLSRVLRVYRHHDIDIPRLPPIRVENKEHYEDLPTYDEIKYVLQHSNTKTRARVTFLASSGMRVSDMCNLTVNDLIVACEDYVLNPRSIPDFLHQLQNKSNLIIPTWHIKQQKTGVPYITFCSDEASRYIVNYLLELSRKKMISRDDLLFGVSSGSVSKQFKRISTRFGLGQLETRCRFHPHALRKFFATTLTNHDCDFLSVEFMLGHRLDSTREAYYKADPVRLRQKYMQYLRYVTFLEDIRVRDIKSSELEELEELREWKRDSVERIRHLEEMMNLIDGKL